MLVLTLNVQGDPVFVGDGKEVAITLAKRRSSNHIKLLFKAPRNVSIQRKVEFLEITPPQDSHVTYLVLGLDREDQIHIRLGSREHVTVTAVGPTADKNQYRIGFDAPHTVPIIRANAKKRTNQSKID